jgi:membrane-associated phospholipid phosphatase
VGGATAVYVVGRMLHSPRAAAFGSDLVRAQVLDTLLTQAIKVTVDRTRPDGGSYSFPSGHASSSFATATVIAKYFGWKFGVPAYAAASYVAASRLSENQHYLSDVVFGASLGVISGRTVTVGRSRLGFAPMASLHGIGLSMVRISQ